MSDRAQHSRADVVARLERLRPLVEEHSRLTDALAALETPSFVMTASAGAERGQASARGAQRAAH